jgi:hypothetical protein
MVFWTVAITRDVTVNRILSSYSTRYRCAKKIVMSIISPDSLVVAVKLGHMLVICRSKSSLCLDLLNEIRVYIHMDEALAICCSRCMVT